jgi:integrase
MATVRKRTWIYKGERHAAWVVNYTDQSGTRRLKTFAAKKAADEWLTEAAHQLKQGTHTPDSDSITVADACELWIKRGELEGLERSTVRQYRQHTDLHIVPLIGTLKLSRLTTPKAEEFKNNLLGKLSRPLAAAVLTSLRSVLAEAMRQGRVAQNVAREVKIVSRGRHKRRVEIPTKSEVQTMLAKVSPRWRPFMVTAIFTGLRASELRGLTWADVDLSAAVVRVRQRADRWNTIGAPKSEAGMREIMLPPIAVNTLREWKLACPIGKLGLVFPNGAGNVDSLACIANRMFGPLQMVCGITRHNGTAEDGSPILRARYGLQPSGTSTPHGSLTRGSRRRRCRSSWVTPRSQSPSIATATCSQPRRMIGRSWRRALRRWLVERRAFALNGIEGCRLTCRLTQLGRVLIKPPHPRHLACPQSTQERKPVQVGAMSQIDHRGHGG